MNNNSYVNVTINLSSYPNNKLLANNDLNLNNVVINGPGYVVAYGDININSSTQINCNVFLVSNEKLIISSSNIGSSLNNCVIAFSKGDCEITGSIFYGLTISKGSKFEIQSSNYFGAILNESSNCNLKANANIVGSIVSKNNALIKNVLKFAHLRLSPPTYALLASEAALSAPESYLEGVINEYTARRNTLIKQLEQIPYVEVSKPMGAFYCIVKLPVKDAEDFSKFLLTDFNLNNQTVMLAPAKGFYSSPNVGLNEVRIAFILDQKKLVLAATILEKALEAYKKFVN